MKNIAFMMSAALLFQGCTYAISPDVARQADTKIPFDQLEADPDLYRNALVILGGTIAATTATTQGTLIEVVQKALDHWGKPLSTARSGGRFLVWHTGFIDVQSYRAGREITVAGVVEGRRRRGIDQADFAYPVLRSKELKLWPEERGPKYQPHYLDPLYDPYTHPRELE